TCTITGCRNEQYIASPIQSLRASPATGSRPWYPASSPSTVSDPKPQSIACDLGHRLGWRDEASYVSDPKPQSSERVPCICTCLRSKASEHHLRPPRMSEMRPGHGCLRS